jgi:hypothetical protein
MPELSANIGNDPRHAGAYARVVLLNCQLGNHINPPGWSPLTIGDFTKTAWFAELQSTGDGATIPQRVAWSRQLTNDQAAPFATTTFLQGSDHWQPSENNLATTQPQARSVCINPCSSAIQQPRRLVVRWP